MTPSRASHAARFVAGALPGIALYHATFGFTSAWYVFIAGRRAGLRAQLINVVGARLLPLFRSDIERVKAGGC